MEDQGPLNPIFPKASITGDQRPSCGKLGPRPWAAGGTGAAAQPQGGGEEDQEAQSSQGSAANCSSEDKPLEGIEIPRRKKWGSKRRKGSWTNVAGMWSVSGDISQEGSGGCRPPGWREGDASQHCWKLAALLMDRWEERWARSRLGLVTGEGGGDQRCRREGPLARASGTIFRLSASESVG